MKAALSATVLTQEKGQYQTPALLKNSTRNSQASQASKRNSRAKIYAILPIFTAPNHISIQQIVHTSLLIGLKEIDFKKLAHTEVMATY